MADKDATGEAAYYEAVSDWLAKMLQSNFTNYHLEITAHGNFSGTLKVQIPKQRDIIFSFLREASPDITGFVFRDRVRNFIVVEVKSKAAKLDDIYQTKKYADLFNARYALLISMKLIPEELRRLSNVAPHLLTLPEHGRLTLVELHFGGGSTSAWFSDDPFPK